MGLIGEGYDQREERKARETLPICEDCPNPRLREVLKAARASSDVVVRRACWVAEELLRRGACDEPELALATSAGNEFEVAGAEDSQMVCGNPNSTAAETIITHTEHALARGTD